MQTYIGGIQRFSTEDGPGIRTTVFFKGCPLRCQWCHNPELLDPGFGLLYREKECIHCGRCIASCPVGALSAGADGIVQIQRSHCQGCGMCIEACCTGALFTKSKQFTIEELLKELAKDKDYYALSGGGITLSGGEILSHGKMAREVAQAVTDAGYTLAIETSGFGNYDDLAALAAYCDWILFDMKIMDRELHKQYIGVYPDVIRENLELLCQIPGMKEKIIIRVPLIGEVNDTIENAELLRKYIQTLGLKTVHLLPYHNMGISKAREAGLQQHQFTTPSDERLAAIRTAIQHGGVNVIVMGREE
ncbi:glycyl-radical enzyme activating protein [uncultured Megasphaera sp.]|uniref:glycyl-radical enzyme activating protein n=1 Tax=uncultured Megasphaera sp. TaxID=165188 RepID=UPI002658B56E|nr:glycyl-radical enzyme activating protein [uncultured Megasphaera sp.]